MAQEATEAPAGGEKPDVELKEGQEPTGLVVSDNEISEPKTFDANYVKQLRAEAAANRKKAQEAEQRVTEFEERDKSELEKLAGKVAKAEQSRGQAEAKLLRFQVAADKEVPAKLVPLLTAASQEELEAQADLILENAKPVQAADFDGGARDPAPAPKTPAEEHNDLAVALFGAPRQVQ